MSNESQPKLRTNGPTPVRIVCRFPGNSTITFARDLNIALHGDRLEMIRIISGAIKRGQTTAVEPIND